MDPSTTSIGVHELPQYRGESSKRPVDSERQMHCRTKAEVVQGSCRLRFLWQSAVNSCDVLSDIGSVPLDYSLQMRVGIANATSGEWINPCESAAPKAKSMLVPVGPLYPKVR